MDKEQWNTEWKIQKIFREKHDYLKTIKETDEILDTLKDINLEVKRRVKAIKAKSPSDTDQEDESNDEEEEIEDEEVEEEDEDEQEYDSNQEDESPELTSNDQTNRKQTPFVNYRSRIKLPPQTLTHFSGKFSQWPSFWDDFKSSVHNDPNLENIQKLKYLRGLLHDEPYRIVSPYPLTNKNYPIIIKLLKSRYDHKGNPTQTILNPSKKQTTETIKTCLSLPIPSLLH
ncbi:hypothetical protein niasHT_001419 [Heterodera trifolii]|uniref:Uncharacterized protein n=1 Tax=Heterodera trifolii TaxID=157864 RepID=A0ABD2LRI0_9BILA